MNEHRQGISTRLATPLAAVAALLLAAVAVLVTLLSVQAGEVERQRDEVGNLAVEQALTIEQVCAAGGDVARVLAEAGQCARARDVQSSVASAGVPLTVTVRAAAVVDPEELVGYVRQQVALYCGSTDGCDPPLSVLVDAVGDHLRANPPPPGRAPTEQEIRAAVQQVLTSAPDLFRGEPGRDATDDQVAAQVAAYCGARGDCSGPKGDQGVQGVGVRSLTFARDDAGECVAVVELYDPADGSTRTVTAPAGDAACDPVVTTTEPLPTS